MVKTRYVWGYVIHPIGQNWYINPHEWMTIPHGYIIHLFTMPHMKNKLVDG